MGIIDRLSGKNKDKVGPSVTEELEQGAKLNKQRAALELLGFELKKEFKGNFSAKECFDYCLELTKDGIENKTVTVGPRHLEVYGRPALEKGASAKVKNVIE